MLNQFTNLGDITYLYFEAWVFVKIPDKIKKKILRLDKLAIWKRTDKFNQEV